LYQNSEVFITGMIVLHEEMKSFSKSGWTGFSWLLHSHGTARAHSC
jgi:hypothetical protein